MCPKNIDSSGLPQNKKGIVYISEIPPKLNLYNLKKIMNYFGSTNRIHLEPRSKTTYSHSTNSMRNNCKEGWIEFLNMKDAKSAASLLNGQVIRKHLYDSKSKGIWNLKYLHGFQWKQLIEEIIWGNVNQEVRLVNKLALVNLIFLFI
jgi:ESF2/ABP1 family protein